MSKAIRLGALWVGLLAVGCGDDADPAGPASAATREATEGLTDDGVPIVFAGARPERPSTRQARRDEENLIREPNVPDPEGGEFTLEEAVVGLPIDGTLVAEIGTEFGTVLCDLYADRAPRTVANFVGLARGIRPFWDARAGEWVRRPYYRGTTFHRVVPEYLIQGGDYLGDGTGTVGYTLEDELHDTLSHDRAGQLAMANADGPDSAGAQFFISDGPAPQLDADDGFTIFGQCQPTHVISQIARVPQDPDQGNRPRTPVHVTRLIIQRVEGGAAAARPTPPRPPEGGDADQARGASPSPLHPHDPHRYGEPSPLPPGGRRGPPSPPIPLGRTPSP